MSENLEQLLASYPVNPEIQSDIRQNKKPSFGSFIGSLIPGSGLYYGLKNIVHLRRQEHPKVIDYLETVIGSTTSCVFDASMILQGMAFATQGAVIGSTIFPGVGTVTGAVVGGIAYYLGMKGLLRGLVLGINKFTSRYNSPVLDFVGQAGTTIAMTGLTGAPFWFLGGSLASSFFRTGAKYAQRHDLNNVSGILRYTALLPNIGMGISSLQAGIHNYNYLNTRWNQGPTWPLYETPDIQLVKRGDEPAREKTCSELQTNELMSRDYHGQDQMCSDPLQELSLRLQAEGILRRIPGHEHYIGSVAHDENSCTAYLLTGETNNTGLIFPGSENLVTYDCGVNFHHIDPIPAFSGSEYAVFCNQDCQNITSFLGVVSWPSNAPNVIVWNDFLPQRGYSYNTDTNKWDTVFSVP